MSTYQQQAEREMRDDSSDGHTATRAREGVAPSWKQLRRLVHQLTELGGFEPVKDRRDASRLIGQLEELREEKRGTDDIPL